MGQALFGHKRSKIVKSVFFIGIGADRVSPPISEAKNGFPEPAKAFCASFPIPSKLLRAALTGCEGRNVYWKPFSSSGLHRPRGPHNPTQIHLSSALLCNVVVYVSNSERKQRARKPPLRGVWGVIPKP